MSDSVGTRAQQDGDECPQAPSPPPALRFVAWNIRAGGGRRIDGIAAQLAAWAPDVVALSEVRATPPSLALACSLREVGLEYQRTTADPRLPQTNALLVASRWPLRPVSLRAGGAPAEPLRWLLLRVTAPEACGGPFAVGAMHVPNYVSARARKLDFLAAMLRLVHRWRGGPALLAGDTNTGRIGVDEASPVFDRRHHDWMEAMHRRWPDAFRRSQGDQSRGYTWYSPNAGNGFRLDQAFVHPAMAARLRGARHEWGRNGPGRRDALSDHAALLVDFAAGVPLATVRAKQGGRDGCDDDGPVQRSGPAGGHALALRP